MSDSEQSSEKLEKLSIGSLDDPTMTVHAQFNPRELQIERNIAWGKHSNVGQEKGQQMEFTGQDGRTTTIELLFDASEGGDINGPLLMLEGLAVSKEPSGTTDKKRRPHHCVLAWGSFKTGKDGISSPIFPCVILGLSIKYTMFSPSGKPLRATASVKLQEAEKVSIKADDPPPQSAVQSNTAPTK